MAASKANNKLTVFHHTDALILLNIRSKCLWVMAFSPGSVSCSSHRGHAGDWGRGALKSDVLGGTEAALASAIPLKPLAAAAHGVRNNMSSSAACSFKHLNTNYTGHLKMVVNEISSTF